MKSEVLPVEIRGMVRPTADGPFHRQSTKVFVIQVERNIGNAISMYLRDIPNERPLTHDLINHIFKGFSVTIERVVITELKNSTYLRPAYPPAGKRTGPQNRGN